MSNSPALSGCKRVARGDGCGVIGRTGLASVAILPGRCPGQSGDYRAARAGVTWGRVVPAARPNSLACQRNVNRQPIDLVSLTC